MKPRWRLCVGLLLAVAWAGSAYAQALTAPEIVVGPLQYGRNNPSILGGTGAPSGAAAAGSVYISSGGLWQYLSGAWSAVGGGGSVSSVGLSLPPIFSITGSPVTSAGTLAATLAGQAQNSVWAGPASGGSGLPAFRSLTGADLPTITVLGTVATGVWQATPLGLAYLAQGGATTGQVLTWSGSVWAPASPSVGAWTGPAISSLSSDFGSTGGVLSINSSVPASGVPCSNGTTVAPCTLSGASYNAATNTLTVTGGSGTVTSSVCEGWDSNMTVAAGTLILPTPAAWTGTNTIKRVDTRTYGSGSPGFTVAVQKNGTGITGCTAIAVSGTSTTTTTCTATTYTGSAQIGIVVSSPTGTPNTASVCVEIEHALQ